MNKSNIPGWLTDWLDFKGSVTSSAEKLDPKFLKQIQSDLKPSSSCVLSKILVIHTVTSLISLMICPQLGFGGFFGEWSLMNVFMMFGHSFCFFLCGAFFIFSTLLMAKIFLEVEEQKRFFKDRMLVIPSLVIFSFGVLKMLGGGHHTQMGTPTDSHLYWIIGAMICGFVMCSLFANHMRKPESV